MQVWSLSELGATFNFNWCTHILCYVYPSTLILVMLISVLQLVMIITISYLTFEHETFTQSCSSTCHVWSSTFCWAQSVLFCGWYTCIQCIQQTTQTHTQCNPSWKFHPHGSCTTMYILLYKGQMHYKILFLKIHWIIRIERVINHYAIHVTLKVTLLSRL